VNEAHDLLQALLHSRLESEIRQDRIDTQSDHHLGHHGIVRVANLHRLKARLKGNYAVSVSANRRAMAFRVMKISCRRLAVL
jgi:hypothetical protein